MRKEVDIPEKPIFIPPRKRGSKSSLQSNSSNQLCSSPVFAANKVNFHKLPISEGNSPSIRSQPISSPPKRSPPSSTNRLASKGKNCTFRSVEIVIDDSVSEMPRVIATKTDSTTSESLTDADLTNETSALNTIIHGAKRSNMDKYVTLTGTIKRGRKKGQTMDMKVNISREELDELEHSISGLGNKKTSENDDCFFNAQQGPHLFLLTVVFFPFVFFISAAYSFYMGTMTWYNVLVLFSEKRPVCQKVFVSPLLIIFYPFLILVMTFGLGIYAAIVQLSWNWENWKREVMDWEKGFYGWICAALNLEDCSPYEVVILAEIQQDPGQPKATIKDTSF